MNFQCFYHRFRINCFKFSLQFLLQGPEWLRKKNGTVESLGSAGGAAPGATGPETPLGSDKPKPTIADSARGGWGSKDQGENRGYHNRWDRMDNNDSGNAWQSFGDRHGNDHRQQGTSSYESKCSRFMRFR